MEGRSREDMRPTRPSRDPSPTTLYALSVWGRNRLHLPLIEGTSIFRIFTKGPFPRRELQRILNKSSSLATLNLFTSNFNRLAPTFWHTDKFIYDKPKKNSFHEFDKHKASNLIFSFFFLMLFGLKNCFCLLNTIAICMMLFFLWWPRFEPWTLHILCIVPINWDKLTRTIYMML